MWRLTVTARSSAPSPALWALLKGATEHDCISQTPAAPPAVLAPTKRAAAVAAGRNGLPYRGDSAGTDRARHAGAGRPRGSAKKVRQPDSESRRVPDHMDRPLDQRCHAGSS